jgi:DNA ligase-1
MMSLKKTLPTLYKRTNTGAIETWIIETIDNTIHIIWGQLDTLKPQETFDTISKGKNQGRSNETTPIEQAQAEAIAKWTKQLKKSYCKTLEDAQNGKSDEIVEGGIVTMLAYTFEKQGHKIIYPAFASTKIDGIRCVAIKENDKWTLWSRTRKPIKSMPHIINELNSLNAANGAILDGELFSSKISFEEIIHFTRSGTPIKGHEIIEYHVFDTVSNNIFIHRSNSLDLFFEQTTKYVKLVKNHLVNSEEEMMDLFNQFLEQGYEGLMLRNADGFYEHKRSYNLIKLKLMTDSEFPIIGIHEGRGKDIGTVGKFICKTPEGKEFGARLKSTYQKRRDLFNNPKEWQGMNLTVIYQNLTKEGIPRFPIGKALRQTNE